MSRKPRIVVVGSLVMDFVASAPVLPKPGETVLGLEFGMFGGGKGANQAVQAARLDAEVFLIGRVGADDRGNQLLANLASDGVNTEFVGRDPKLGTAACCIHVDERGRNSIIIVPLANSALSPDHIASARSLIESADILLAQLEVPLPAVQHAFEIAAAADIPTILNPAPAQPLPTGLLARTTYLTPNELEAATLTAVDQAKSPNDWENQAASKLLRQGPRGIIITLAERGSLLWSQATKLTIPTFPVTSVDTTAAGDAFCGALGVALAEKQPLAVACRFANAAGALATTARGAQPSLPTRRAVEELLQRTSI
jgi:ribokinase